jgi:DHA3 family macrolide efflux protein-like MFS transporter
VANSVGASRRMAAILVGGLAVSGGGGAVSGVALSWLVLTLTGSRAALGWVGAVGEAAGLLTLVSGVWVDRWDRRRTLLFSDVLRAGLFGLMGILALTHGLTLPWILVLIGASRVVGAVFAPALYAFLPQLAHGDDLVQLNAALSSTGTAARIGGQAVAGALLTAVGPAALFLGNAGSFMASVLSLSLIRAPASARPTLSPPKPQFWRELGDGLRAIGQSRFLTRIVGLGMAIGFFAMAIDVLDVAWVRQVLHQPARAYAAFLIAQGAGVIAGSLMVPWVLRRVRIITTQVGALLILSLAVAALSRLPHLGVDLALMALLGVALGIQGTTINVVIQALVPNAILGRAMGALGALTAATQPLGAVASGLVASAIPLSTVFLAAGIAIGLAQVLWLGVPNPTSSGRTTAGIG